MSEEIRQTYELKATPGEVFRALTDPNLIETWSGAPASMEPVQGGRFEMFGGEVVGSNLVVEPEKKLVQSWRFKSWNRPTTVTFALRSDGDLTTLDLLHEGVPEEEKDRVSSGWREFYLGRIEEMLSSRARASKPS